jgi:hypothetical protein
MASDRTPGPLDISFQSGQGGITTGGGFGLPGPVGLQSRLPAPVATKELNIVGGDFDWDPPITDADEINKLNSNLWSPGTKDFVAVVNSSPGNPTASTANDFGAFLGAIVMSAKGSITRINLITHANKDLIAFGGKLISTATLIRDVQLNVNPPGSNLVSLDVQSIKALAQPGVSFQLPNNQKQFFIADIRDKFASGATIVLYACHSGLLTTFIQDIAKFFQTKVVGFTTEIAFCPPPQTNPAKFIRTGMQLGIGSCASKVSDFRTLINNSLAVTATP